MGTVKVDLWETEVRINRVRMQNFPIGLAYSANGRFMLEAEAIGDGIFGM